MPDYHNAEQTELSAIADHERFLLRSPGEIRTELLNLAKKPDIITAYFNEGREFILTAVLGVLSERGLVVLDVGPDDETTRRAIATDKLVCTTRSNGVPVKFSCSQLKSAKFQGQQAIAAALPDSLYRQQRREYFRVSMPRINAPTLRLTTPDERKFTLKVLDLSLGGLGLADPDEQFHAEIHSEFFNCQLSLPEFGELEVNIQIRNQGRFHTSGGQVTRYGAAFINLPMSGNLHLQRYLYHLQTIALAE